MTIPVSPLLIRPQQFALLLLCWLALSLSAGRAVAEDWLYTVKKGDTLWDLCLQYTREKGCWMKVGDYNGVEYPPSLLPGTRIRFPVAWLKARPVSAEVVFIRGEAVLTLPEQNARAAAVGDKLPMGSRIRAAENSSVTLQFADGASLVLEADSEIVMDTLTRHGHTGMVDSRLNLISGAAKSRVPTRTPRSRFEVSTPSAIAAVRGTDFRVSALSEIMLGEVFEGSVAVAEPVSQSSLLVNRGFGVRVKKNEPVEQALELLPAVAWLDQQKNVFAPYSLQWQPVKGAVKYKLELLRGEQSEHVFYSQTLQTSSAALPEITGSCFVARVSAVDEFSLQGLPAQRSLCVALAAVQLSVDKSGFLHWPAVAGADKYRIETSTTKNFSDFSVLEQTDLLQAKLPSGSAYYRVIAVDREGRPGKASNVVESQRSRLREFLTFMSVFAVALVL